MMNLRNNKGVTLLVLTITIIVLLIITSITIGNFQNQLGKKNLNNLYSDIESISTKISDYYLKNNSLPVFEENAYMNSSSQLNLLFKTNGGKGNIINSNDEGSYYVINLSKLDNLTLNYGREYSNWDNNSTYEKYQDLYIINETTHQIYYPKGVKYNGKKYFTGTNNAQEVNKIQSSEIADDGFELTIIKSNKNYISDSDKAIVDAEINLNIGSNFMRDTLEYSWNVIQDKNTEYTKFELDTQNSAMLISKQLDDVSEYYLNIKILDNNGKEHILEKSILIVKDKLPETAEGQLAGTAIRNPVSYGNNPNAQATADGDGKYFALPKGATYVEGTVDTGVVINIDDSEFVWVPVPEAIFDSSKASNLPTSNTAGTKQGNTYTPMGIETSTGNYSGILYNYSEDNAYLKYPTRDNYQGTTSEYREPDIVGYDGSNLDTVPGKVTKEKLQTAYNEMIAKVAQYGGFYVGRYEMGIEEDKIVSKNANENVSVTTTDSTNEKTKTWYGLYQAGENFETTAKVKSSMIWGSQYDAMMNWLAKGEKKVDATDTDKYNQETITGKSETDVINNVYDLYGCHNEWTLEADSTGYRVGRGGFCYQSSSPAKRISGDPSGSSPFDSSRLTLYIE